MQVLDFIHCVSVAARIVKKKKKKALVTGDTCTIECPWLFCIFNISNDNT